MAILSIGSSGAKTHKVQKSETFYAIAARHGVTVSSLMAANGMSDAKRLRVGQNLTIPTKGTKSTKKSKSSPASKVSLKSTSSISSRTQSARTKRSLRVVIDPGHGGRDRGAVWGGVRESDLNLRVANRVESGLKAKGYSVTMTRRSDTFVSLARRAQISNGYRNAVFVSIHFNATRITGVRGAETFYAGSQGLYLAKSIQRELVGKLKVRNRGVRFRRFTVLRQTSCPAVLVECGFISNPSERARCKTSAYQSLAAKAIVAGIERYDRSY